MTERFEAKGWPHDPEGAPKARAMTEEEMTGVSDAERELAQRRLVLFETVDQWLSEGKEPDKREFRWLLEDIELLIKFYDADGVPRDNLARARREIGYVFFGTVLSDLKVAWRYLGAAR
jgi:hypothetical protein